MNISIDVSTATPTALKLTAAILTFLASYKENPSAPGQPLPSMPFVPPAAPVAPVVPSAPAVTTLTPPIAPLDLTGPGVEITGLIPEATLVDSAGEAWNGEMHTANQSKNSDGTWRRKRTTPKGDTPVAVAAPRTPIPPPPPVSTAETVAAVPPTSDASAVTAVASPVAPPAPPVSVVVSDKPSPLADLGGDTFGALVKYATNLVGKKLLSTAQLLEACAEAGVADIHACSKAENAPLIPFVALALESRVAK